MSYFFCLLSSVICHLSSVLVFLKKMVSSLSTFFFRVHFLKIISYHYLQYQLQILTTQKNYSVGGSCVSRKTPWGGTFFFCFSSRQKTHDRRQKTEDRRHKFYLRYGADLLEYDSVLSDSFFQIHPQLSLLISWNLPETRGVHL